MRRVHVLAALGLLAMYCGLAVVVPPADDEFYYWCWTEHLQLSYYDHPPMTAYFVAASAAVFGKSLFAIRFPACVATAFVFGVMLYLTRPRRVLPWVAFSPIFTFAAVLITPDTPLLFFWAAYLVWLVKVHERLTPAVGGDGRVPAWLWLAGGVVFGCGVLGKYTTALAGMAGFVSFLAAGRWRRWLPGYVLHGVVAFAVASPILIHNINHDFLPLKYQWEHSMTSKAPGLKPFADFFGAQLLLFGTAPLALFPWALMNARRLAADPRLRVCLCLYAVPYAFFLYKATRGPLEGNWALACYIAFWPLLAEWYETARQKRFWRWAMPAGFLLPTLVVLGFFGHLIRPVSLVPPAKDRITRQSVKVEVAKQIRDRIAAHGEKLPVYVASYQMCALLRFYDVDARQIEGVTRPSHFTQTPEHLADADRAYVVWEGTPKDEFTGDSKLKGIIAAFPIDVRGEVLSYYILMLYAKPGAECARPAQPIQPAPGP